jgi:hypothetical protein
VSVVESWQQTLPGGIDHAGVRPAPLSDLLTCSNRNDTVAKDGYRLSLRLRRIDSPDVGIFDDEVGGRFSLREDAERASQNDDQLQGTLLHFFSRSDSDSIKTQQAA